MEKYLQKFKTLVIGAGPAGTGLLFNALASKKRLNELLDSGIAFVDRGQDFGGGTIGRFMINSDSSASVFLECLQHFDLSNNPDSRLEKMIRLFSRRNTEPVPLEWVGDFLKLLGGQLKNMVECHPKSHIFFQTEVVSVFQNPNGTFCVHMKRNRDGSEEFFSVEADSIVFAMGGYQSQRDILRQEIVPGLRLSQYENKIVTTDSLFTRRGFAEAKIRVENSKNKKVVVIGGSHSAFASLQLLLNKVRTVDSCEAEITLMHRSKLKLFYASKEQAHEEGYTDFTDDDICPLTKKVYRLAGLRLESRELLKRVMGIGGNMEHRVRLLKIFDGKSEEIKKCLEEAFMIIPALGYKPRTVPIYSEAGRILLSGDHDGPLVNKYCQVTGIDNQAIPNVYGLGLASGFVPWGEMGGEPGFKGQTNGLWLYQNNIGGMIFKQLTDIKKSDEEGFVNAA